MNKYLLGSFTIKRAQLFFGGFIFFFWGGVFLSVVENYIN